MLRHAISRKKNLYFPLPQESMRTTFHYPESPHGRTYADVITKISRMDSLPNNLSYGAPFERASRARSSAIKSLSSDIKCISQLDIKCKFSTRNNGIILF